MNYLMKRHMMMSKRDERSDYGSREEYRDHRGSDYARGYDYRGGDYRGSDYRGYDSRDYRDYRSSDMMDRNYYGSERDMRSDYNYYGGRDGHSMEELKHMYHKDLEKWTKKLKEKDRFNLPKEEVLKKAKNMGVSFMEYTEEEFYAIYLLMIKLFKSVANEPHTYLAMAKAILEEPDSMISPEEKIQVMLYEIAMGGKQSF